MASTNNSLVMGVAAGYTPEKILPFLKSLRSTAYRGKVCLFVQKMDPEDIAQLRTYVEDVIPIEDIFLQELRPFYIKAYAHFVKRLRENYRGRPLYPHFFRLAVMLQTKRQRQLFQLQLEQFLEGQQSLRYFHYLRYLEEQGVNADYVMLSDVRDVLFQSDPFERLEGDELQVFQEADHVKLGTEPFNSRWILDLYGTKALAAISDDVVCCSGTTIGSRHQIVRYLSQMTAEIVRHPYPLGSHDQAIHNYLLRQGRFDPVTIYANGEGAVMTLGLERDVHQDEVGRVWDKCGHIAPVVHQYDRHSILANTIMKQYD